MNLPSPSDIHEYMALPKSWETSVEVGYRSTGLGVWGMLLRYAGMPLEKIALEANSSRVQGSGQLMQATRNAFQEGWLAPFRVVTRGSLVAWFLQYSIMGFSFQIADRLLSSTLGVRMEPRGDELFGKREAAGRAAADADAIAIAIAAADAAAADEGVRTSQGGSTGQAPHDAMLASSSTAYNESIALRLVKISTAPIMSGMFESTVSNRAECVRFFGPQQYAKVEGAIAARQRAAGLPFHGGIRAIQRTVGHAYMSNSARNAVMCASSFIVTPHLFMAAVPETQRTSGNLFWFGLGTNIFLGNVVGVTMQSLWGRSLDFAAQHNAVRYRDIVRQGLSREGIAAFLTPTKWFTRVLMNAPAQGTIPWFYNKVLPMGEPSSKRFATLVYRKSRGIFG